MNPTQLELRCFDDRKALAIAGGAPGKNRRQSEATVVRLGRSGAIS